MDVAIRLGYGYRMPDSRIFDDIARRLSDSMPASARAVQEDLEKNLIIAKNLGFEGMLVLHPKELELVHKYFSPSDAEVDGAREMLRLYDEAAEMDKGVALMDGKFIGPPMVASARKVISRHDLIMRQEEVRANIGD